MGNAESNLIWPTHCVAIARNGCGVGSKRLERKRQQGWTIELHDMATSGMINLMTPDCSDRSSKNSKQQGLSNQAKEINWQTPEARNQKGYHVQKDGSKIEKLGTQAGSGKLNPSWVEQLMGLPVGWTQLSSAKDQNRNRIDRLRLLGNGVVPATAAKALTTLLGRVASR